MMNDFEHEELLVRDMIEYFKNNKYDSNNSEVKKRLIEYISKLCELETEKMGYKVKTHLYVEQDEFDEITESEDNGILNLFFINRFNNEETAGFYGRNLNKSFSTPRAPLMIVTDYGTDWMFKFAKFDSISACALIIQNLLHELRHMKQDLMARTGVSSNIAMTYAKEYTLTDNFYNFSITERDANIDSIKNIRKLFNNIRLKHIHSFICTVDGITMQIDEYISNTFDKIINNNENQHLLQMYPILKKEYNDDGSRKSAEELIENMHLEINDILQENELCMSDKKELIGDCKEMYFEIIYKSLTKLTREEITNLLEKDNIKALFEQMKLYFHTKYEKEQSDTREYIYFEEDGKIEKEINLRRNYYQSKIDYLDKFLQDNKNLNNINIDTINSNEKINTMYDENEI